MLERPPHLAQRQFRGRAFGDSAQLVRTAGTAEDDGTWTETEETPIDITCATAPVNGNGNDARVRQLMEGGVALEAIRTFWTVETITPAEDERSLGDLFVYDGQRWRARGCQPWKDRFTETLAVRQEGQ